MNDEIMTRETDIHAMRWEGDVPVAPHRHDFIEIAFLVRGSCLHAWQGTEVRLVPGDVFVIAPGEMHAYRIEGMTAICNCLFYPVGLGEDWEHLQREPALQDILVLEPLYREDAGGQEILHFERTEAEELERLWMELIAECVSGNMGNREARKALLVLLLVRLGRAWSRQFEGLAGLYGARRSLLAEALSHIERNAAGELSLSRLAEQCHVSQGHFRKLFREATGLAPLEYVNKLRISMAQRLLADRALTIAQVAEAVGIQDPNYFTRLFRNLAGCTPTAYRERIPGEHR